MSLNTSVSMLGNQNRSPARPFSDCLRTELFLGSKKRMTAVVHALLTKAESGDIAAIKEIADRIEGKVASQDANNSIKIVLHKSLDQMPDLQAITVIPMPVDDGNTGETA